VRTGGHTFYDLHVDLIFITKYRRGVITDRVRSALEAPYTPKTSISNLVNSLKGVSSRRVRAVGYPEVRRALWGSAADQLVVVTDGDPDALELTADQECVELIEEFEGPAFLVANKMDRRARRRVNLAGFEQALSLAARRVEVSYNRAAAENLKAFSWTRQPPSDWAISVRELAALIAISWPQQDES